MVASHNTFTYLTPTKWWAKIINFAARCQSKTIDEQYKAGVRFFDIRIKNLSLGTSAYAYDYGHTVTTYKSTYLRVTTMIRRYSDCGFRIINEDSKNKELFREFCKMLISKYPANISQCIEGRDTWKVVAKGDYPNYAYIINYSRKTNHWWQFGIRWPWVESMQFPRPTQQEYEDTTKLYWYDFI